MGRKDSHINSIFANSIHEGLSSSTIICKLFSDLFPDYKSSKIWNLGHIVILYIPVSRANTMPVIRSLKYGVKFNGDS